MSLHGFYNKAMCGASAGHPRLQLAKDRLKGRGVALIGVGGLRTPDMALEAYNSHMADFVACRLPSVAGTDVEPDDDFCSQMAPALRHSSRKAVRVEVKKQPRISTSKCVAVLFLRRQKPVIPQNARGADHPLSVPQSGVRGV